MKARLFLRVITAFLLVIAVALVALSFIAGPAAPLHSLLVAGVIAGLVAAALAALLAEIVSRRFKRLTGFAERLAAGDLSARLEDSGSGEVAQLADALDGAARRLEQSFTRVEFNRQQMITLLNSMQEPVLAVSTDQRIEWANGAMERLTSGLARPGAAAIEALRDPDFLHALRRSLLERTVVTVRARSVSPGRIFAVTVSPMPGGAVVVLHDLTAIERMEKTRRDFIANVSHELRTPLTSIQGYAETLLEMTSGQTAAHEFVEIIRRNAERMARLTDDLLTLARVESGEHKLSMEPVLVRELAQEAVNSLRETARNRDVEILLADLGEACVLADRDAVHQVFANLLENALKYAGSGRKIEVGGQEKETELELWVRDFGPGISSEHLPRLFERFYRVDKARSREAGGTGLGLAIVKHIILNHGGAVRAESQLGRGSTFYFTLPLATTQAAVSG